MPEPVAASNTEAPSLAFRAALLADTLDEQKRTVDVTWTTGSRAKRYAYDLGGLYIEELVVTPAAVNLKRLNAGAPLLDNHNAYSGSRGVVGVVVRGSARIENGVGRATIRFDSDEDELARTIFRKVRDGILTGISVGYRVHKLSRSKEEEDGAPVILVTKWEPFELSVVPMAEDIGAGFRGVNIMPAPAENTEAPPVVDATRTAVPAPAAAPPLAVNADEVRAAAITAERQRATEIRSTASSLGFETEGVGMIERGLSIEAARAEFVQLAAARRNAQPNGAPAQGLPAGHATTIASELDSMHRGLSDALYVRAGGTQELDDNATRFRGMSLIEVGRDFLEAQGVKTRGLNKRQIADKLFERSGAHTTTDFPLLLADVAYKRLTSAYTESPQTFAPLVTKTTLPDFKTANIVNIGDSPDLEEIPEHGEYTAGTTSESREQWRLKTYGKKFAVTRQLIINDDLAALGRVTQGWGQASRRLENDLFWTHFLSNPTMGADSKALYHADHLNTGVGVIAIAGISSGRVAMRKQTNLSGNPIEVYPRFLICPVAVETTAEQFVSTNVSGNMLANASSSINPFAGKLTIISDAHLDASSALIWYLQASPQQIETFLVATLEGESGPYIESRNGFNVDGLEVKVRHDFAVKVVDHRGIYRSTGAP